MENYLREGAVKEKMGHGFQHLITKRASHIGGKVATLEAISSPTTIGTSEPNPDATLQGRPTSPNLRPRGEARAIGKEVKKC